jgi:penicillin-binding protein 1A
MHSITPRPPRRGFIILGSLLLGALAIIAVAALLLGLAAAWFWPSLPSLDKATAYRPIQHLQIVTSDGVEIAQFGSERRIFVPVAAMPQQLKDTVIALEDHTFYEHHGISLRGLARAAVTNVLHPGNRSHGASTITQQVARTFFLSPRRTLERKIKEGMLALQLESRLSKDQILELYLNEIFLGQHAYGFAAAAQTYFGKTLAQLTLAETALLAGLPKDPIHANPVTNLERAQKRQRVVLGRLKAVGQITEAQQAQAVAERITVRNQRHVALNAEHVAEMARRAVVERLGERAYTEGVRVVTTLKAEDQRAAHTALRHAVLAHGRKQAWRGPEDFESLPAPSADRETVERAIGQALKDQKDDSDLRIAIVLSAGAKELVAQLATGETVTARGEGLRLIQAALSPKAHEDVAVRRGSIIRLMETPAANAKTTSSATGTPTGAISSTISSATSSTWSVVQWPEADGAFVAMDPSTGRIRALVGGFDFGRNQFNRAIAAWRQPGSSFKPFLYSAAFEAGVMPQTRVDDLPLTNADGSEPNWNPKNSDDRFEGEMSVRDALVKSKNLVSVRLLKQVGLPATREWVSRFGFDASKQPDNLTLALGSGSVTPMQLATGYAVFANGGHLVQPLLIERITDAQGKVLFEAQAPAALNEANRAIPERNAFLVNSLLNDVTKRGTAARAQTQLKRSDLYGKTGTTNDAVDAWFAGFQPSVVAVAWVGYDEPQSLGERESGGGLALPMWLEAMGRLLRGVPQQNLVPPAGVVAVYDDWRYAEFAEGGWLAHIGPAVLATAPAQAASAAADGAAAAAGAAPANPTLSPAPSPFPAPSLPPSLPASPLPAPAAPSPAALPPAAPANPARAPALAG